MLICAPILIPLNISTSKNGKSAVIQTLTFYSGKILSYISLGLISGYVGYLFGGFITARVIGGVLIALGIFIFLQSFLTGIVIGFRPCSALLALFSIAVLTKSALLSWLMRFVFGFGTLLSPLLIYGKMSYNVPNIKEVPLKAEFGELKGQTLYAVLGNVNQKSFYLFNFPTLVYP